MPTKSPNRPKAPKKSTEANPTTALTPYVDVDLVRIERNLLQIGFFGSHDPRYKASRRRIEQVVNREGRDVSIVAEFEAPLRLGLPSTTDLDKFLVFLKIAGEQRARQGRLVNPIRFTGARMLSELRLSDAGRNYEAVETWCDRMKQTTIRSEMAIFLSQSRKYANRSIGVFRGYQRVGEESLIGRKDRKDRHDTFEITVEDWLLDNLNNNFIVIEDLSTYILLGRPVAKGMFGHLLVWFRASSGRKVEKDYNNLCALLNIKAYTQRSRIEENLGKSLDELKGIGYLSRWEIAPMSSKDGYKINMWPGDNLLSFLRTQTKGLPSNGQALLDATVDEQVTTSSTDSALTDEQQQALNALLAYGVAPRKAELFARSLDPANILDHIEYVDAIAHPANQRKVRNPPGMLIHFLDENIPVPNDFVTTRKRNALEAAAAAAKRDATVGAAVKDSGKAAYDAWVAKQVDAALERRYPGPLLSARLRSVAEIQTKENHRFAQIPAKYKEEVAQQIIRKEIQEDLAFPNCEDWCKTHTQYDLFS
jgi:hypothetical protein